MKCFCLSLLLIALSTSAFSQSVLGKWKTIDDETNEAKSVVELYEKEGKVYGRIIRLFRKAGEDQDPVCTQCDTGDARYQKKIIGMEIIKEMQKSGEEYTEGNILDPNNGKIYNCKMWLEGNDLKLRGYWGPFFRTQTWVRIQ